MVDATTLLTQALLVPFIKKTSEKISKAALKGISKNKIVIAFKNEKIANEYSEKIVKKIFSIRTLSQDDKTIYLDEIYHPLSITSAQSHNKITISDSTIIPRHTCICITGVAGQGKTTIMKKLFLEELVCSDMFPFFITMRQFDFNDGITCECILLQHLDNHGIECSLDDVKQLLKTKDVVLFFDGFDEVPLENRANALNVIESVNNKFGCMSITSSRPNTEITRCSNIEIYNVGFLNEKDIESIIKKIIKDTESQNILISTLKSKDFLKESIKTPILVDVFIVTSSSLRHDPNSIGEYYNGLFPALIYRHDLLKNLTRDKKSTLDDKKLEICFSLLSFLSFTRNKHDFSKTELLDLIYESCNAKKYTQNEGDVYHDMINGTNLIVEDGYDHYVYIHRSIQEYYCAKTISNFNDNDKEKLFNKFLDNENISAYFNLFVMLSHIDFFDLIRFYIIPYLEKNGCYSGFFKEPLSLDDFTQKVLSQSISIRDKEDYIAIYSSRGINGDNWYEVSAIETIHSIINNGEHHSCHDEISKIIMGNDNQEIYDYLIKNKNNIYHLISKESHIIKHRNFKHDRKITSFELKSVAHLIPDFTIIISNAYDSYIQYFNKVDSFINDKYLTQLESDISISSIIGDINI